ncbi:putative inactive carboxylesterase 4 [Achroia grisella]|uniref:putative inactive carboxylesterase 4 n=1 Tax=Achroia grisella TaxID=688607 RepID=UPI0027D2045D|nr:putative inactive carboxylesterase 4 [Achroia grisella]
MNIFVFYGIPYAKAPTGPNRFQAPLPAPVWTETLDAVNKYVACPQPNQFLEMYRLKYNMQEDCLIANVYVPNTSTTNQKLPVVVYVHGGAFHVGLGDLSTPKNLVQSKNVIVVTFNYRLGVHGFLCLGTKYVPGNAGMKDQIALLQWVKKNVANFGGNSKDITLVGYSAGATSVDLLLLSPLAKGLFNKVIVESGSNTVVWSVQQDPLKNAKDYAKLLNFTNIDDFLLRSIQLHVEAGNDKVYLYEYSFVEDIDIPVQYPSLRGARHCAHSMAVLDGPEIGNTGEKNISDEFRKVKATMRELVYNFVKTGNPAPEGSSFPAWPPANTNVSPFMEVGRELELKAMIPLEKRKRFWDAIYEKYYRSPIPPPAPPAKHK